MFTAIKAALGPNAKNLGGAIVFGAGSAIGASLVGITAAGLGKLFTKASEELDKQIKKRKMQPSPYAQPSA